MGLDLTMDLREIARRNQVGLILKIL